MTEMERATRGERSPAPEAEERSLHEDAGPPDREYEAALSGIALLDRSDRVLLQVSGRAPGRMLAGVVTGALPPEETQVAEGVGGGRVPYSAILTPKGKVVTDLRLLRLGEGEGGALLMDLPRSGLRNVRDHLTRYLPPRFARVEEPEAPLEMLSAVGPGAFELLAREIGNGRMGPEELKGLAEGEERTVSHRSAGTIRVIRSGDVRPPAFDLVAPREALQTLRQALLEAGAVPMGTGTWEVLRIEKGRPAYGVELDWDVLLPEAGVVERAVDQGKGCYTGQEVIVRIRDRGRVNRRLRGILLGDLPLPDPGAPLFHPDRARASGEVRSAARSPRFGQGIALGYVRREVEPPAKARLGDPEGPEVGVRALDEDGWVLEEGDH